MHKENNNKQIKTTEEKLINKYNLLNNELEKYDKLNHKIFISIFFILLILLIIYIYNFIQSSSIEVLNSSVYNLDKLKNETFSSFDITLYSVFFSLIVFIFIILNSLKKRDNLVSEIVNVTERLDDIK